MCVYVHASTCYTFFNNRLLPTFKLFNMKIICNDTLKQQFFFCFINAISNEENRGVFVHLQHKPM